MHNAGLRYFLNSRNPLSTTSKLTPISTNITGSHDRLGRAKYEK